MTLHNYQTNCAIKKKIFCGRCACIFTIFSKIYAMGALVYGIGKRIYQHSRFPSGYYIPSVIA